MSLFGKKNPSPAGTPAPLSVFGTIGSLFNPRIGDTIRPLGETGKMLVTVIAMVFAANGLFPKNHPAFLPNSTVRLYFGEVMRIGWSNVKFTREALPQTLIFFAVVLSLGCSCLAILLGLVTLMTGTAHAQGVVPALGPGMFEPPPQDSNDIACGWINWLFGTDAFGCDIGAANYLAAANGQQVSNLQSTTVQTALIAALGFYSDVILVIAAVVLFYHLTAMIVETAHHGVIMGRRANQIWAPIRLVVAVGLLVPIASGLNSGQYIVIQVAQWGTMVASNAWNVFLFALAADGANQMVPPLAPIVRQEVTNLILDEACVKAWNDVSCPQVANAPACTASTIPNVPTADNSAGDGSSKFSFSPSNTANGGAPFEHANQDICGYYVKKAPMKANTADAQLATDIQNAGFQAFDATLPAITTFAQTNVLHFIEKKYDDRGTFSDPYPPNTGYEDIINQLYGALQANLTGVQRSIAAALNQARDDASKLGWVAAGSWFNTIARLQGMVSDLAHDFPYTVAAPQVIQINRNEAIENKTYPAGSPAGKTQVIMERFSEWLNKETNLANPAANGLSAEQTQVNHAMAGIQANNGTSKDHYMEIIFTAVDWIAARDGVWQSSADQCVLTGSENCFSLGVQFTSANPLAEIAAFGHSNINTAYDVFDDYVLLMGLSSGLKDAATAMSLPFGQGASRYNTSGILVRLFGATAGAGADAASSIGDMIGMIVVVFFAGGFMLAFFLPLIPFYRFMFGTLSWFLSLLEAVIAVPLIALAHLTPEGEGFMGDKAKGAYYFLFNLFLRPTLMVFGLAAGFLLFCIAASLMNLLFTTAVASSGGFGNGHNTLARIVYSIIYVVILYLSCNKCFQLIDWLPEHCIKWMGASGLHHAPMGNPEEIGGYMGLASGYVEQKIVAGTGAFMKSPAGGAALAAGQLNPTVKGITDDTMRRVGKGDSGAAGKVKQAYDDLMHHHPQPPPGGQPPTQ